MVERDRLRVLRVVPVVAGENRDRRFVTRFCVHDVELVAIQFLAQRQKFRATGERLLDGVGQIDFATARSQNVRQIQRNILPDIARQIVTEHIRQIVFGDAIVVARHQIRTFVGDRDFRAQHVEFRNRARVEAMLLVVEFFLQQFHRRFVNGDFLRGEQHS